MNLDQTILDTPGLLRYDKTLRCRIYLFIYLLQFLFIPGILGPRIREQKKKNYRRDAKADNTLCRINCRDAVVLRPQ